MASSKKSPRTSEKKVENAPAKFPWGKFVLGYVLFVFFHEIDRLLPGTVVGRILGEGFESIYAHMKMLFFAYLILSLIDYFRAGRAAQAGPFLNARMLILSSVPWMMIIVYYTLEAVGIFLPRSIELPWALLVTAFGLYFSLQLEGPLERTDFPPAARWAIAVAFAAAFITYVGFSFAVPDNFFIAVE